VIVWRVNQGGWVIWKASAHWTIERTGFNPCEYSSDGRRDGASQRQRSINCTNFNIVVSICFRDDIFPQLPFPESLEKGAVPRHRVVSWQSG
jgi:hypothetical protein